MLDGLQRVTLYSDSDALESPDFIPESREPDEVENQADRGRTGSHCYDNLALSL